MEVMFQEVFKLTDKIVRIQLKIRYRALGSIFD